MINLAGSEVYQNLVSLGDGRFGVMSGNSQYLGDNTLVIYEYDHATNQLVKVSEVWLDELE